MGQGLNTTALAALLARARRRAAVRRTLGDLSRPVLGTALLIIVFECVARVWSLPDLTVLWLVLLGCTCVAVLALVLRRSSDALVLHAAGELAGDTALFESLGRTQGGQWDALVEEAARERSEGACREGAPAPLEHRLMPLVALLAVVFVMLPGRMEPARAEPALLSVARAELAAAAQRTKVASIPTTNGSDRDAASVEQYAASLRRELAELQGLTGTEDLLNAAASVKTLAAAVALDGISEEERAAIDALLARLPHDAAATPLGETLAELGAAARSANGAAAARSLGALARRLEAMGSVTPALRRLEFVADAARSSRDPSSSAGTGLAPIRQSHSDSRAGRARSRSAEELLDRYFREQR